MNPLVAPDVCRFSVIGTYAGRNVANIFDLFIDQTGSLTDRQEAIEDQAAIIVSAWADNISPLLVNNYSANEVRWLDLDSLTGSVGSTTTGTGTDFPSAGASTAQAAPGNVAIRVNRQIAASRGQRKGRLYLCGLGEDKTDDAAPNTIISSFITTVNAGMAQFKSDVEQNAGVTPPNYDSQIVVLHTHVDKVDPDDPDTWVLVYDGRSAVSEFSCDATLGSMRRRLRG